MALFSLGNLHPTCSDVLLKPDIILFIAIFALAARAPLSIAQAQQFSEQLLAQLLMRFPEADLNGDGKLTAEEFQAARQQSQEAEHRNARRLRDPLLVGDTARNNSYQIWVIKWHVFILAANLEI